MEKILGDFVQNKNVVMFTTVIAYILGLFAYFSDNPILFASIVTTIIVVLLFKNFSIKIAMIWLFMFYLAFLNATFRIKNFDDLFKFAPSDCVISGQIVSIPNSNTKGMSKFFLNVEKISVSGQEYVVNNKTYVSLTNSSSINDTLLIGDYYEINGKLRQPFKAVNPSQFSYGNYLRNYNTFTTFYADIDDITKINRKLSFKWKTIQYLNQKRNNILKTHSTYLKSPNLEILGGIVFGDDAVAPPDYIKATFVNSGLLHILAASGMNVAFISGFLFFFLQKLNVPFNIRIWSGILVIILYALMTGLGASVIRASLMLIFILLGKLVDRDAHSVALLAFVGLLMLIYNPAYINDVGFQLSFVVTFGLLVSADAVMKYTSKIPVWLSGAIAIPLIAQVWVIPIQMFYFNNISVYSVFANVLTMPFLSVISFGGFVSSVFSLFEPIAHFVCCCFDFIINPFLNVLVWISTFFAKLPHALFITTHPSILQVLLYYLILLFFVYLLSVKFENKKMGIATIVLSIVLLFSTIIHIPNKNFEVLAFDVGNADAFLLKTPQNKYFIIDTGKSGYNGGRSQADIIILKYLKDKGIKNIEGLIITHFDNDHAGGAVDIINNLNVKSVYMNSLSADGRIANNIFQTINESLITKPFLSKNNEIIYTEKSKHAFVMKTYKADIRSKGKDSMDNENSVQTLVEYGDIKMLFTGDAGIKAFNQIKQDLPQNITVLKVGHHGAKDVVDREMLEYLNPKVSLVSVGYNNYGHPYPLTVKLLSNTKVLRIDKINATKITTNGKDYKLYGFDSKLHKFYEKK